jgi:3-methyladenine DNA glycosylase/8-oxoguanine DNA glycosylase
MTAAAGGTRAAPEGAVEVSVRPPWPFRLPRRGSKDGVMRSRDGIVRRLLHLDGAAVVVHAWQRRSGEVTFRAAPAEPGACGRQRLELAIERMRFALGVDDDLRPFYDRFRSDPLVGPAIRRRPWLRPRKRPLAWEALAWAVTEQLIEAGRAAEIQRRIVRRWGPSEPGKEPVPTRATGRDPRRRPRPLRDVPCPATFAARAPAELAACDLAPSRAISLIRCAREVASGRVDPADPAGDRRLRAIPGIGPWTLQCLGCNGRGEPDSLPAGDVAYVKLVGRLAGLRRRATIPEIEEFYAPYEPYRAWAGYFTAVHYHAGIEAGPPLRLAA